MAVSTAEPVSAKLCRLVYEEVPVQVEPFDKAQDRLEKLVRYFSSLSNPSILGWAGFNSERNRYSYFAAQPVEIFEFFSNEENPFEKLKTILSKYRLENGLEGVFTGGWIGFFSYDLNTFLENVPACGADDTGLPLIRLCFYDKVICFDHLQNCFYLFAIELPEDEKSGQKKIAELKICLAAAASGGLTPPQVAGAKCMLEMTENFKSNITKDYYLDALAKIKRYIYDGDVYQINFSQRFSADFNSQPYKLFL
jgi:para-aminobenzoate synthetase component 1